MRKIERERQIKIFLISDISISDINFSKTVRDGGWRGLKMPLVANNKLWRNLRNIPKMW